MTTNRNGTSRTGIKSFKTGGVETKNLVKRVSHARVTATSALLSMTIGSRTSRTRTYFRYHTARDMTGAQETRGQHTNPGCIWSGAHQFARNLKPKTTYYYQAVAKNPSGTHMSGVMSFTTK